MASIQKRFSVWLLPVLSLVLLLAACTTTPTEPADSGDDLPQGETTVATYTPAPDVEDTAQEEEPSTEEETDVPQPEPTWGFKQMLLLTLNATPHNYAEFPALMGDSFEIMTWYGGVEQVAPADAITLLEDVYLPPDNTLTWFEIDEVDTDALFGGNPFQLYTFAEDFFFTQGWGADGSGEALLFISQIAEGDYYWSGMLYAEGGFAASAPEAAWVPLPATVCEDLQAAVEESLGMASTLENDVEFFDYIKQTGGTGCQITVAGTGVNFENTFDTYSQLGSLLETMGWTSELMYDAGGPTGQAGGYVRDSAVLLLNVSWAPSEDADCPGSQPISACELAPEQQLYTITLAGAMQ